MALLARRATNDWRWRVLLTAAAVEIDDGGEIGNPDPTKDADEDAVVISAKHPRHEPPGRLALAIPASRAKP